MENKLPNECRMCMARKYLEPYQDNEEYLKKAAAILSTGPDTAIIENELIELRNKYYEPIDYQTLKNHFNKLMIKIFETLKTSIDNAADPLLACLKMALAANYIDFSAFSSIDESKLENLLCESNDLEIDMNNYNHLLDDLAEAQKLLYISDNCGEIIIDAHLIELIKQRFPDLEITLMSRKEPYTNDITYEDAMELGLDKICKVVDNGSKFSGTFLNRMSEERKQLLLDADVIISKGQANAESLFGSKLNIYYVLLCKCDHFAKIFQTEKLTPKLEREKDKTITY